VITVGGTAWIPWNNGIPTVASYPNANQWDNYGSYTAFETYFSDWYAWLYPPSYNVYPSQYSMTVLPTQTGTNTIILNTNPTYDSWELGGIQYSLSYTSGNSASIYPSYIQPQADSTTYSTLTVTTGATQLTTWYVDIDACGYGGCQFTQVAVNPVP
jgi:hypothetical protein